MNFNTVLILVGILISSILVIENMVVNFQAYVLIWITQSWILAAVSIVTGIIIGYGLKGKMLEDRNVEEDGFWF